MFKSMTLAATLACTPLLAVAPVGVDFDKLSLNSPVDVITWPLCWSVGLACSDAASAAQPKAEAEPKAAAPAEAKPAASAADTAAAAQAAALSALGGGLKVERGSNGELNVTLPEEALQFAVGSAEVSAAGKAELKKFAGALKGFEGVKYSVFGHTDSKGSAEGNQSLSQQRAQAVKDVLVAEGVSAGTFTAVEGKGSAEPVADNASAEGRAKNRRVVVKLKN